MRFLFALFIFISPIAKAFACKTENLTAFEKAVCEDKDLQILDEQLNAEYRKARADKNIRDQDGLLKDQQGWYSRTLQAIGCDSRADLQFEKECMKTQFNQRIEEIKKKKVFYKKKIRKKGNYDLIELVTRYPSQLEQFYPMISGKFKGAQKINSALKDLTGFCEITDLLHPSQAKDILKVMTLKDGILLITMTSNSQCDNDLPFDDNRDLVFDLETGEPISLNTKDLIPEKRQKLQSKVFNTKFCTKGEFRDPSDNPNPAVSDCGGYVCSHLLENKTADFDFHFDLGSKSSRVGPSVFFPTVAKNCIDALKIKVENSKLKEFFQKDSTSSRVLNVISN